MNDLKRVRNECETCMLVGRCPKKCFNSHPGSIRALMKSFDNIDVISETGKRFVKVEGGNGEYVRLKSE